LRVIHEKGLASGPDPSSGDRRFFRIPSFFPCSQGNAGDETLARTVGHLFRLRPGGTNPIFINRISRRFSAADSCKTQNLQNELI